MKTCLPVSDESETRLDESDDSICNTYFTVSQKNKDPIEYGMEKLESSVENLNVRLARLLAEYSASQAKLKQRLAKLEEE